MVGAAIGAGLLFQSGKALYIGGPVSLWLGYLLMGTVMYAVLITLGEMISFLPIPGGFFSLATRFLSPAIVLPMLFEL
jgi:yeast amino acid transporter